MANKPQVGRVEALSPERFDPQLEVMAAIVAGGIASQHGGSEPSVIAVRAVAVARAIRDEIAQAEIPPPETPA